MIQYAVACGDMVRPALHDAVDMQLKIWTPVMRFVLGKSLSTPKHYLKDYSRPDQLHGGVLTR
ncbi:MAG: hypothetical protein NVS2B7_35050 [Herpetosiphon sp.]